MDNEIRWKQRFANLQKAYLQLSSAVGRFEELDDLSKEGLVQRFEYTLELSWKCLKDYLEAESIVAKTPKEVIRQAFHYEFINDGELWIEMLNNRNMLSHTYNEELFHKATDAIVNHYFKEISELIHFFENANQ